MVEDDLPCGFGVVAEAGGVAAAVEVGQPVPLFGAGCAGAFFEFEVKAVAVGVGVRKAEVGDAGFDAFGFESSGFGLGSSTAIGDGVKALKLGKLAEVKLGAVEDVLLESVFGVGPGLSGEDALVDDGALGGGRG